MKNKAKFTLLLFIIIPFLLKAQPDNSLASNSCFTDQLHNKMLNENPYYASKQQMIEKQIYNSLKQSSVSSTETMTTQTIPVVVHIVHDYGPENISDEQVIDAIQHLNDAFANVGYYDPDTGVDIEIDFCLSNRDPQNNASTGINRIASPLTNLTAETQDLALKSLINWNAFDYLNIWVVKEITSISVGSGVGGYAYLPWAHGFPQDGIVIEDNYFGTSPDNSKVFIHEAGHYLGLYHTFRGGCTNDNCLLDGDRVCDTPPDQSTIAVECGDTINTCHTDEDDTSTNNPFRPIALGGIGDQNDMYINYMDYGDLACYSAFTEGQKVRMKSVLSSTRLSLLESVSCQEPCPFTSYEANFSFTPASPVLAGDELTFTNNSDPAHYYEWRIDEQIFSNDPNSSYTFDQEGIFTVSLLIRDTINYCKSTAEQVIEVVCVGAASFSRDSTEIINGETIVHFTNTSTAHDSYEWFLDGVLYSTDTDLSITFTDPGYYTLYLVGVTSTCLNFSAPINIDVEGCSSTEEYKREMHWYFGNKVALDFNSGAPVFVSGSEMNQFDGAACISDEFGNLQFYTEGRSIWDATNTVMPNGTGLLGGLPDHGNDQVIIVPRPFHPDQYYVITTHIWPVSSTNGVRYSIVDMNLNGGLGDVTDVKNVYICPPRYEVLNAAYHADGEKAWLLIESDAKVLTTYLIDSSGFGPPITYADVNDTNNTSWHDGIFFNSGKKFIIPRFNRSNGIQHLLILDFDNSNGTFSNPIAFRTSQNEDAYVHSMALSPDDRKLYAIMREGPMNEDNESLYQFYLPLAIGNQVAASRTQFQKMSVFNELLLGPNGKIYVSNYDRKYLGVINHPNENGFDCNFVSNGLNISPAKNRVAITKFIKGKGFRLGALEPTIDLGPDQSICSGATIVLNDGNHENYNYLWQDGSTNPTYTAWLPGTYWVTVSNDCGSATDEINIEIDNNLVDLGEDIVSRFRSVILDAGNKGKFYLWQDGSTNSKLTVTESGEYWVRVTTEEGCFQSDTISVSIVIPTNFKRSSLILYPNPSNGLFILEEEGIDVFNDIELTIFDPLGRKVYEQSVLLEDKMEIDLREYSSGIYFLHWSTFENSGVFKLIVASQ